MFNSKPRIQVVLLSSSQGTNERSLPNVGPALSSEGYRLANAVGCRNMVHVFQAQPANVGRPQRASAFPGRAPLGLRRGERKCANRTSAEPQNADDSGQCVASVQSEGLGSWFVSDWLDFRFLFLRILQIWTPHKAWHWNPCHESPRVEARLAGRNQRCFKSLSSAVEKPKEIHVKPLLFSLPVMQETNKEGAFRS